jgi:hypothetical protein
MTRRKWAVATTLSAMVVGVVILAVSVLSHHASESTRSAGSTCGAVDLVSREGLFMVFRTRLGMPVAGLVPDQVHIIGIRMVDGSIENSAVVENAFVGHYSKSTRSVVFDAPSGRVEHDVTSPAE